MIVQRSYYVNYQGKKVFILEKTEKFVNTFCVYFSDQSWDEDLVYTYYDQPVDYTSDSLFFNIAVQVH